jgi:hypothetical protein
MRIQDLAPAEMAKRFVDQCGSMDLARRTAEALASENFAMNPTDSSYWHEVAEVLRNEMVSQ